MIRRLKSLELQGIKTFATISRLEFPGQITAIVGPNGSGKSNIADSIRWVLGEQSFSTLRAKRTEDMIFAGSQQRSRAGMASTTITFDNEDGWLPIDYSEVSISRRAYRDGQNEYLLNGQKVRLKDISELLSQTGLSERTYTIIGQGLVDVALALKPDERRKLFEEAAGIGLYRSRKEEALRRLESTRKNLDRVLDIMTEIRPRLRSLERQAGRFMEFERLRTDLELLLREWYGFHWHQKQQDLRNAKNTYLDLEKRLNDLRQKYDESQNKVEEAREALHVNRRALETAHRESSELHQTLEQVSREIAIIDERERSNAHQKGNLEIDIANVQEEISGLIGQKQSYEDEIVSRQASYEAAQSEVQKINSQLSQVTSEREIRQQELNGIRKARIELETKKVHLSAKLDELSHRTRSLENEKTKIQEAVASLETERAEIQNALGVIERDFSEAEKSLQDILYNLKTRSQSLDSLKTDRLKLDSQIADYETKLTKLQAQLDVLNQAEAALSGYSEGSKNVVEFSEKGQLPKGIEPLSKHLVIDEKFEKAISVALGELTDLLVVPSGGKDVVIEYLEKKENDRVVLVTLDHVSKQSSSDRHSPGNGLIGYASDLIEADPEYRELAEKLFSDILIVEDRRSAMKLMPKLKPYERVVTLNGVAFQANGIMILGQNPSGKRLGRTRRQGEMRKEIADLESLLDELHQKRESIIQSMDGVQADLSQIEQEVQRTTSDKNQLAHKLSSNQDTLSRLEEQKRWHDEQLNRVVQSIQNTQVDIETGKVEIASFTKEIDSLLEKEAILDQVLEDIPVFDLQQERNHWQTHLAIAENALETARQRFEEFNKRIDDAQKRLQTYQDRLSGLQQNKGEIDQNKALLREKEAEISAEIDKIKSEKISPLAASNDEFEKMVSAVEKLETHSHQQVLSAERHFTQAQIELSRREDQLTHLRERIESDFGLVSFDYEPKIDGPTPLPLGDELIEQLPNVQVIPETIETDINRLKGQIRRIGAINPEAKQEYLEVKERFEFLTNQINDLEKATKDLNEVIEKLDSLMERDFIATFKSVNQEFSAYFARLFNGGEAKLLFSDEQNPVEGGIDIEARLPGRRRQELALLSGGERSLTAVALIFALLKVSPTPFCVMDEVDAMLDESNVGRFIDLLKELSKNTQFVIITHNRNTVQAADVIYGVTMGRDSTSQMISLKLEEVDERFIE